MEDFQFFAGKIGQKLATTRFLALKFNYLMHFIIQKYLPILGLKIQKDFFLFSNKMWDPNLVGDDVLFKTLL